MYVGKRRKRRTAANLKIYNDRMRTQRISMQNPKYGLGASYSGTGTTRSDTGKGI